MILLLHHEDDPSAPVIYRGLTGQGFGHVAALSDADAALTRVVHRVIDGIASTTLTLTDGQRVADTDVTAVVNRWRWFAPHLTGLQGEDALYGSAELQATWMSILHGMGGKVVNAPDPFGLAGRMSSSAEWAASLRNAGIPARVDTELSLHSDSVIVIGRSFSSTVDVDLSRELAGLLIAKRLRTAEMRFSRGRDGLLNPSVEVCVDFAGLGPAAIDALGTLIRDIAS